jgi:putative sterol carrier protein
MTVQDVFARIAAVGRVPTLSGVTASCRFDIAGAGSWLLTVRDGTVDARRGAQAKAECTIAVDEADFLEIIAGRRNTTTAIMQGRVVFRGDVQNLPVLQQVFLAAALRPEARPEERP